MISEYRELLELAGKLIDSGARHDDILGAVCFLLRDSVPHYDWVGIYFANNKTRTLNLGPYAGEPTEHVRIPYGQGICGQSAESHEAIVVRDVSHQENYLACSPLVRSEMVVPIMRSGKFAAQLDIDSHGLDSFTDDDLELLGEICQRLGRLF